MVCEAGFLFLAQEEQMARKATREELDKAHDMGVRDKNAGAEHPNKPHDPHLFSKDLSYKEEINDSYKHGFDSAPDQKNK